MNLVKKQKKKFPKEIMPILFSFIILLVGNLPISCINESDSLIKSKLNVILDDDLKEIIRDIKKENLLHEPYYEVKQYKEFKKGKYYIKAVVNFYFFKNVNVMIERKYRYNKLHKKWDRYFNEYRFDFKQQ